MLSVVPGKACIVFIPGVDRKIVQVPVTLFLQISIPISGTVYQFCNFFSHFILQNGHKNVFSYVTKYRGHYAHCGTPIQSHLPFTGGWLAGISIFYGPCAAGSRQLHPLRNSDLGYYITSEDDFSHTLIGGAAQNITLNSKITLEQYTRILFLNYPGSNDGALLAIAPGDKIITAFRNNGVWEEKSSQFIATKSDLFSNLIKVTDIHNIRKSCLFRAEYGAANTPTKNVGYIGLSVYVDRTWHFVICSPYSGGKLFFDSVNTSGSWIGWKEIAFK